MKNRVLLQNQPPLKNVQKNIKNIKNNSRKYCKLWFCTQVSIIKNVMVDLDI